MKPGCPEETISWLHADYYQWGRSNHLILMTSLETADPGNILGLRSSRFSLWRACTDVGVRRGNSFKIFTLDSSSYLAMVDSAIYRRCFLPWHHQRVKRSGNFAIIEDRLNSYQSYHRVSFLERRQIYRRESHKFRPALRNLLDSVWALWISSIFYQSLYKLFLLSM